MGEVTSTMSLARPTAMEVVKKFAGPKVDIYVGSECRHYHVPKDILCHYSKYFNRCFNGGFKEAEQQVLNLPEDDPEWFEYLLDSMICGGRAPFRENSKTKEGEMDACMKFIEYADKYDLLIAAETVVDNLTRLLAVDKKKATQSFQSLYGLTRLPAASNLAEPQTIQDILEPRIPLLFRAFPDGHDFRARIARYCWELSRESLFFQFEEREVPGFAAEILRQARITEYGVI